MRSTIRKQKPEKIQLVASGAPHSFKRRTKDKKKDNQREKEKSMSTFDDDMRASRRDKLLYYGERAAVWTVGSMVVLGMFLLFWQGWVQGHARYWEARKTADICDQHRDSIMDSDHLRSTCKDVGLEKGTYPVVFAMQYTLMAVLDWTISTICHIGASWITSGFMGVVFAVVAAYLYRRLTGPSNPYAAATYHHHHPIMFHQGGMDGLDTASFGSPAMIEYNNARALSDCNVFFRGSASPDPATLSPMWVNRSSPRISEIKTNKKSM